MSQFNATTQMLRQQWTRPTDVFSILLILGGEIVNKALAQLTGYLLTPVTFSFGAIIAILLRWVSYSVTTFLASVGDARLMPNAEGSCIVINTKNGYVRSNCSWILGRILRDYEYWMNPAIRSRLEGMLDARLRYMQARTKRGTRIPRPTQTGLCVSIYEPSVIKTAGEPTRSLIYWSGLLVALVQLVVSAVPMVTSGNWRILLITAAGTVLAFVTGSLPQWKEEKWPCRRNSYGTYALTRGNGSQHVIVILGNGRGLNLEDLAVAGQSQYPKASHGIRLCLGIVSILWITLLITATGVVTDTWYLLAVGGIGMVHNLLVAGARRDPGALGIHLDFRDVVGRMETMEALLTLETKHSKVGRSLLPIFFPGKLLPEEEAKWATLHEATLQQLEKKTESTSKGKLNEMAAESWATHAKTFEL